MIAFSLRSVTSSPLKTCFPSSAQSNPVTLLDDKVVSKFPEYLFEGTVSWFNGFVCKDVGIYDWKMVFLWEDI